MKRYFRFQNNNFDDIFLLESVAEKFYDGVVVSEKTNGLRFSFKKEFCKELKIEEVVTRKLLGEIQDSFLKS